MRLLHGRVLALVVLVFSVASGLPQIPYFYVEGDPFRDMVVHEGLIRQKGLEGWVYLDHPAEEVDEEEVKIPPIGDATEDHPEETRSRFSEGERPSPRRRRPKELPSDMNPMDFVNPFFGGLADLGRAIEASNREKQKDKEDSDDMMVLNERGARTNFYGSINSFGPPFYIRFKLLPTSLSEDSADDDPPQYDYYENIVTGGGVQEEEEGDLDGVTTDRPPRKEGGEGLDDDNVEEEEENETTETAQVDTTTEAASTVSTKEEEEEAPPRTTTTTTTLPPTTTTTTTTTTTKTTTTTTAEDGGFGDEEENEVEILAGLLNTIETSAGKDNIEERSVGSPSAAAPEHNAVDVGAGYYPQFSCHGRSSGYHADPWNCRTFHLCERYKYGGHRHWQFRCGPGTFFSGGTCIHGVKC